MRAALGPEVTRRVFRLVVTNNGAEFADEDGIAGTLGEEGGETHLFCCDPRRADQKGDCEKNHVGIRNLLPKGRGLRFDRLTRTDAALVMSQVNSEPHGRLAWRTPAEMPASALREDVLTLLYAFAIEMLAPGALDLTAGYVERAHAEGSEAPLAD